MKRFSLLPVLAFVFTTVLFASCAARLKPLDARQVQATPQPLVLKASKVPATITLSFPDKWFHRDAVVKVTPVLKYATGETWGTTYTFQGEKVRGNAVSVSYRNPAPVILNTEFEYKPEMKDSDLVLIFSATINNKEQKLPDLKIGEGVLATEALASVAYVTPAIAPDAFQRVIQEQHDADIHFLIQQANLRSSELNSGDVQAWKRIIEEADAAANKNLAIEVQAYASPDGGRDLNERLAAQRERNTSDYLKRELDRTQIDAPLAAHYTAQDWEGFKTLVERSNIQDKDLVLRVLSMYNDPEVREREIKNISTVFSQLADEILPQLRRSRLIANIEIIGKSDEEIIRVSQNNPASLTIEELLYAASLTDRVAEQERLFNTAARQFPNDPRPYNNLAALALAEGDIAKAKGLLANAENIAHANNTISQEAKLNLGLIALSEGNIAEAESLLGQAGNVPELGEALGLIYIKQGRYSEAARALYNVATNNGVLAQILDNNYAQAKQLLDAIQYPDATTHYLAAVVGTRTNDTTMIEEGIRRAVELSPSLADELLKDREFARYASQGFFVNALRR